MVLKRESNIKKQRNGKFMLYPQHMKWEEVGSPDSRKSTTQMRSAPAQERSRR